MTYTLAMEIRDVTESRREIVGQVAPYNETSYLTGDPRRAPRARCFRASIAQRGTRIPLIVGHEHGRPAVGLSTRWEENAEGLLGVFALRPDARGDEALADARDGYLPALCRAGFSRYRRGRGGRPTAP